jgi:hypothetical protein
MCLILNEKRGIIWQPLRSGFWHEAHVPGPGSQHQNPNSSLTLTLPHFRLFPLCRLSLCSWHWCWSGALEGLRRVPKGGFEGLGKSFSNRLAGPRTAAACTSNSKSNNLGRRLVINAVSIPSFHIVCKLYCV